MNKSNRLSDLKKNVAPYEEIDMKSSVRQLINTLLPLALLWYGAYLSLSVSYWLTLPITIIAGGFLVRTFIIFHDCCHQSFFKSRLANEILGTITGVLTLCPYQQWKNTHSIHHATSSNLDKRGVGDMWLLTIDEYMAASAWTKFVYRMYRNPFMMLVIGPIYIFLVAYRFNRKDARRKERISTYVTNVSLVGLYALLIWAIGWQAFVLVQLPIFFISGMLGIWLFYVQHQFEHSYFEHDEEWEYVNAAVEGSSYYKLPKILQWITGNIGFHHVHHLSPKVPNYNLEKAHEATPPLQKATTITIRTSLQSLRFRLWDERSKTFVSFKELREVRRKPTATAGHKPSPLPSVQAK
ncbi:fatty acid desaturase [Paenibacillus woosongensis]|uniref:Fatty acid desaturase n=1 Tax=Paenibacillus woosongensis TaxID=307580 RepID=A0A7X2YYG0_9BACL|nr:fatty acid desaturase [Paenibacillus woosongensis]MUG44252.1 fatty acid desaturase [Paenibacillus woosongensis]